MTRQQRRKFERNKSKYNDRSHSSIDFKGLGTYRIDESFITFEESLPLESEWMFVQIVNSDDRQEFEQSVREFGEIIAVSDKSYPPRIEHVVVLRPFPYGSSKEMSKACSTMLSKYSPHNYYAIIRATPPAWYDGSLEHQKCLSWNMVKYFRESSHGRDARKVFRLILCEKMKLGVFDEATKRRILKDLKVSGYVNDRDSFRN